MEYDFSLDRTRIVLLVAGLVLAAIFLFVAGLMVGLAHTEAAAKQQVEANHANAAASLAGVASQPGIPTGNTGAGASSAPPSNPQPVPDLAAAAAAPSVRPHRHAISPRRKRSLHHPAPAAAAGGYSLQAGAFASRTRAVTLQKRLTGIGYPTRVLQRSLHGRKWFVVLAGNFATRAEAAQAIRRVHSKLGIAPFIK